MLGRPGISWRTVLAVSLTASVLPCAVDAGPWSIGAGGGWTSAYRPFGSSPIGSDGRYTSTWLAQVSVARSLTPGVQIRGAASGFAYQAEQATFSDIPFPAGTYRAESRTGIVPIAIGIRLQSPFGRSGISPYLEFLPTLFIVRWEESASGTLYASDSTSSFSAHRELARAVPGATLGLGFNIRGGDSWTLDYDLQYRLSGQVTAESSATSELLRGPLQPIATVALAMSIAWSPP